MAKFEPLIAGAVYDFAVICACCPVIISRTSAQHWPPYTIFHSTGWQIYLCPSDTTAKFRFFVVVFKPITVGALVYTWYAFLGYSCLFNEHQSNLSVAPGAISIFFFWRRDKFPCRSGTTPDKKLEVACSQCRTLKCCSKNRPASLSCLRNEYKSNPSLAQAATYIRLYTSKHIFVWRALGSIYVTRLDTTTTVDVLSFMTNLYRSPLVLEPITISKSLVIVQWAVIEPQPSTGRYI